MSCLEVQCFIFSELQFVKYMAIWQVVVLQNMLESVVLCTVVESPWSRVVPLGSVLKYTQMNKSLGRGDNQLQEILYTFFLVLFCFFKAKKFINF